MVQDSSIYTLVLRDSVSAKHLFVTLRFNTWLVLTFFLQQVILYTVQLLFNCYPDLQLFLSHYQIETINIACFCQFLTDESHYWL